MTGKRKRRSTGGAADNTGTASPATSPQRSSSPAHGSKRAKSNATVLRIIWERADGSSSYDHRLTEHATLLDALYHMNKRLNISTPTDVRLAQVRDQGREVEICDDFDYQAMKDRAMASTSGEPVLIRVYPGYHASTAQQTLHASPGFMPNAYHHSPMARHLLANGHNAWSSSSHDPHSLARRSRSPSLSSNGSASSRRRNRKNKNAKGDSTGFHAVASAPSSPTDLTSTSDQPSSNRQTKRAVIQKSSGESPGTDRSAMQDDYIAKKPVAKLQQYRPATPSPLSRSQPDDVSAPSATPHPPAPKERATHFEAGPSAESSTGPGSRASHEIAGNLRSPVNSSTRDTSSKAGSSTNAVLKSPIQPSDVRGPSSIALTGVPPASVPSEDPSPPQTRPDVPDGELPEDPARPVNTTPPTPVSVNGDHAAKLKQVPKPEKAAAAGGEGVPSTSDISLTAPRTPPQGSLDAGEDVQGKMTLIDLGTEPGRTTIPVAGKIPSPSHRSNWSSSDFMSPLGKSSVGVLPAPSDVPRPKSTRKGASGIDSELASALLGPLPNPFDLRFPGSDLDLAESSAQKTPTLTSSASAPSEQSATPALEPTTKRKRPKKVKESPAPTPAKKSVSQSAAMPALDSSAGDPVPPKSAPPKAPAKTRKGASSSTTKALPIQSETKGQMEPAITDASSLAGAISGRQSGPANTEISEQGSVPVSSAGQNGSIDAAANRPEETPVIDPTASQQRQDASGEQCAASAPGNDAGGPDEFFIPGVDAPPGMTDGGPLENAILAERVACIICGTSPTHLQKDCPVVTSGLTKLRSTLSDRQAEQDALQARKDDMDKKTHKLLVRGLNRSVAALSDWIGRLEAVQRRKGGDQTAKQSTSGPDQTVGNTKLDPAASASAAKAKSSTPKSDRMDLDSPRTPAKKANATPRGPSNSSASDTGSFMLDFLHQKALRANRQHPSRAISSSGLSVSDAMIETESSNSDSESDDTSSTESGSLSDGSSSSSTSSASSSTSSSSSSSGSEISADGVFSRPGQARLSPTRLASARPLATPRTNTKPRESSGTSSSASSASYASSSSGASDHAAPTSTPKASAGDLENSLALKCLTKPMSNKQTRKARHSAVGLPSSQDYAQAGAPPITAQIEVEADGPRDEPAGPSRPRTVAHRRGSDSSIDVGVDDEVEARSDSPANGQAEPPNVQPDAIGETIADRDVAHSSSRTTEDADSRTNVRDSGDMDSSLEKSVLEDNADPRARSATVVIPSSGKLGGASFGNGSQDADDMSTATPSPSQPLTSPGVRFPAPQQRAAVKGASSESEPGFDDSADPSRSSPTQTSPEKNRTADKYAAGSVPETPPTMGSFQTSSGLSTSPTRVMTATSTSPEPAAASGTVVAESQTATVDRNPPRKSLNQKRPPNASSLGLDLRGTERPSPLKTSAPKNSGPPATTGSSLVSEVEQKSDQLIDLDGGMNKDKPTSQADLRRSSRKSVKPLFFSPGSQALPTQVYASLSSLPEQGVDEPDNLPELASDHQSAERPSSSTKRGTTASSPLKGARSPSPAKIPDSSDSELTEPADDDSDSDSDGGNSRTSLGARPESKTPSLSLNQYNLPLTQRPAVPRRSSSKDPAAAVAPSLFALDQSLLRKTHVSKGMSVSQPVPRSKAMVEDSDSDLTSSEDEVVPAERKGRYALGAGRSSSSGRITRSSAGPSGW